MACIILEARNAPLQFLLSLQPRMAEAFEKLEGRPRPTWFATSDPPARRLGSGGGTAHLLAEAWRATGAGRSFSAWLNAERKVIVHGGGQNRRLPAYAPTGTVLMPFPVLRWAHGQRLDQTLLDAQLPGYERLLEQAPPGIVAMVASGDVLVRFSRDLPRLPEADVIGLGAWAPPEKAKDFGVFFAPRERPTELAFFLQKPAPAQIIELAENFLAMVDTGLWLFSERAVRVLMERCGWNGEREEFAGGRAEGYELYAQFGPALGRAPRVTEAAVNALTCAVVPLPQAEFYHFGASEQMIESMSGLQNVELDATKLGMVGAKRAPSQHVLNAKFGCPLRLDENHSLWVENSTVPGTWRLASGHVLTGVPANDWDLQLEAGVCLDFVPVGESDFCVRAYGWRDTFAGGEEARWFGRAVEDWFRARGLTREEAGFRAGTDLQQAPLFPVLSRAELEPRFLEWLFAAEPPRSVVFAERWRAARRLSATEIPSAINLDRLYAQRAAHRAECVLPLMKNSRWSVFHRLDLAATARSLAVTNQPLPEVDLRENVEPMHRVHDAMFRAAVLRLRGEAAWETHEERAFATLREMIVREAQLSPALPRCAVLEDQIVWGPQPGAL